MVANDLSFSLRDLRKLVRLVESEFYNPEPDHVQGATTDTPMVQAGDRHHTQAPCDVGHLDILSKVDSLLFQTTLASLVEDIPHPPSTPPVVGAPSPGENRPPRTDCLAALAQLADDGWQFDSQQIEAILDCWVQVRQALGLTYVGQRSLHEPMTVEEIATLFGVPVLQVREWAHQSQLVRWTVAGQTMFQIPQLRDLE